MKPPEFPPHSRLMVSRKTGRAVGAAHPACSGAEIKAQAANFDRPGPGSMEAGATWSDGTGTAEAGFEPALPGSKPGVLPLDDSAKTAPAVVLAACRG